MDDDAIKSHADNNEHIIVGEPEKSKKRPFKSLRWMWKYNPLRVVVSSLRVVVSPIRRVIKFFRARGINNSAVESSTGDQKDNATKKKLKSESKKWEFEYEINSKGNLTEYKLTSTKSSGISLKTASSGIFDLEQESVWWKRHCLNMLSLMIKPNP